MRPIVRSASHEAFRCAVGYAGICDLELMHGIGDTALNRIGQGYLAKAVGTDAAAFRATSPIHNVDKIASRVLLIHGGKDERAPIAHAERLREALTASGRPPGWLVEPNEGHGFYNEKARERMCARVLGFLQDSLAPPTAH